MVGLQGCLLPWSAGSPRELTDAVFFIPGAWSCARPVELIWCQINAFGVSDQLLYFKCHCCRMPDRMQSIFRCWAIFVLIVSYASQQILCTEVNEVSDIWIPHTTQDYALWTHIEKQFEKESPGEENQDMNYFKVRKEKNCLIWNNKASCCPRYLQMNTFPSLNNLEVVLKQKAGYKQSITWVFTYVAVTVIFPEKVISADHVMSFPGKNK